MGWNFNANQPIYQQLISRLKKDIASGIYPPGVKLPPVRELALEAGVNPNTVQRAYSELEREGLMYTERTSGRFVTKDKELLDTLKENLSASIVDDCFRQLSELGFDSNEIIQLFIDRKE